MAELPPKSGSSASSPTTLSAGGSPYWTAGKWRSRFLTNLRLLWLERSGSKTDVSVKVEEVALKLLRRGDCMPDCQSIR